MTDLPRERLAADVVVFRVGDLGESAYVIEEGCVEVLTAAGRRIALLGEGALFGEVALLDRLQRTATVRTLTPTTLLCIERAHVEELRKRSDPVIQYLLNLLLERFRIAQGSAAGRRPPDAPLGKEAADIESAALRTLTLTRDLGHAVDVDQLELHYQPLCTCAARSLVGYEALVRWRHPTLGMIMPMEFIGLAERTGLIHRIGRWVLRRAIAEWRQLRQYCERRDGLHPFVSVNLSAAEVADPGLVPFVDACLAAHDVPPMELKIELTETAIIEDREKVAWVLEQLAGRGIMIALDDFGTGYAGLEYLKALPLSCLKIDKNFVQEMQTSLPSYEIVRAAVSLAWSLGLSTIAEGVEDERTLGRLNELGCDVVQGYLIARPLPLAAVPGWVAGRAAASSGV